MYSHNTNDSSSSGFVIAITVGKYFGNPVVLFNCRLEEHRTTNYKFDTTKMLHDFVNTVSHDNIMKFVGMLESPPKPVTFVYTYGNYRGWLHFLISKNRYHISGDVRIVLALDVANGMHYLHSKGIVHGALNSATCYLDSNWSVRVGDWAQASVVSKTVGPYGWAALLRQKYWSEFAAGMSTTSTRLLVQYTDPVLLQEKSEVELAKPHDVYSFGMLLCELSKGQEPFPTTTHAALFDTINDMICNGTPFNPENIPSNVKPKVLKCINPNAMQRRTFNELVVTLTQLSENMNKGIVGTLMDSMETYMNQLEDKVQERTSDLQNVTNKLENILYRMLPKEIAMKLSEGVTVDPEYFDDVSIYFSDIVGFTKLCAASSPFSIVNFLNKLYTDFDAVIDDYDVYKVETIGDAYMVVSGVPQRNGKVHVREIAAVAIQIVNLVRNFKVAHIEWRLQVRVGVNSGSCMAGVVGLKMPRYCLFGNAVNMAAKMEQTSAPMKIQASESFIQGLKRFKNFKYEPRPESQGKYLATYWIVDPNGTSGGSTPEGPPIDRNNSYTPSVL